MFDNTRWIWFVVTAAVLVALASMQSTTAAEQAEESQTAAIEQPASGDESPSLDGGQVFTWYCGSCHSERYPAERTDEEWDVIVTHMRVRANLTGEQAEAVLRYLQENNP